MQVRAICQNDPVNGWTVSSCWQVILSLNLSFIQVLNFEWKICMIYRWFNRRTTDNFTSYFDWKENHWYFHWSVDISYLSFENLGLTKLYNLEIHDLNRLYLPGLRIFADLDLFSDRRLGSLIIFWASNTVNQI